MALTAFGLNLGIGAGAVLLVLAVTFAVTVLRRRFDTIDTAWGVGFVAVAVVGCVLDPGAWRGWLALGLTTIWGLRLAVHIHHRNAGRGEDPRYAAMAQRAAGHPYRHLLLMVYPVQGVAMWVVSAPVQAAPHLAAGFGAADVVGIAVWLLGFSFEAVGDAQLARFRAVPSNSGAVLQRGLWRYTRHPNYFGDACVWWGLYLLCCHHWVGVVTIASPLVMTYLLARGTGKPLTERHLHSSRPGYADYVRRTSGFVPRPPKAPAAR